MSDTYDVRSALAESEQRYRHLVQAMVDTVVVHVDGRVVFVNQAGVELVGAPGPENVVGRNVLDFIHPEDLPRATEELRRVVDDRQPLPFASYRLVRFTGDIADVECSATTVDFDGMAAVQIVCRDVTERNRTAATLHHTELQLQQSQKLEAVGRLAGGIAHDFNNLLTVVTAFTQLALSRLAAGDPRRADLDEVQRAAGSAAALTRQLLAFSRKQVLQPTEMDLGMVVRDAEKMLQRVIREDVELRMSLPPEPVYVLADRGQLEQVLMNLVVNARDAMAGRCGAIAISVDVVTLGEHASRELDVPEGRYARLRVTDTGVGMDRAVAAHVFEPFFTTKPLGAGSGLGLSTVYGIVRQSDGAVAVDSVPHVGSTFSVYLPETVAGAEAPLLPASPADGTETILLVEDSAPVRQAAARILIASGYEVLAAESGQAALAIVEERGGDIDLLLTDVVMPGMSGRELGERLVERWPRLGVVFMSGYTYDEVQRRGVMSGAPLIHKPFTIEMLTGTVRAALDRRRAAATATPSLR